LSVRTEVVKQEIGFRFHIVIDKELHLDSGTRTPDKVTVHASIEGHELTYNDAMNSLKQAKGQLLEEVRSLEPAKPQEKSEQKDPERKVLEKAAEENP
jgi:hypothetical protein